RFFLVSSKQPLGFSGYCTVQPNGPTTENPNHDGRNAGVNSPLSHSFLFSSADQESKATAEFCKAVRCRRESQAVTSSSLASVQQLETEGKEPEKHALEVKVIPLRASPLSLSSIFLSADDELRATKAFCKEYNRLTIVNAQKPPDESAKI
ncbi:hypothetical protein PMAYCL1PPCAC_27186, partial [Pristionchus mayeri]